MSSKPRLPTSPTQPHHDSGPTNLATSTSSPNLLRQEALPSPSIPLPPSSSFGMVHQRRHRRAHSDDCDGPINRHPINQSTSHITGISSSSRKISFQKRRKRKRRDALNITRQVLGRFCYRCSIMGRQQKFAEGKKNTVKSVSTLALAAVAVAITLLCISPLLFGVKTRTIKDHAESPGGHAWWNFFFRNAGFSAHQLPVTQKNPTSYSSSVSDAKVSFRLRGTSDEMRNRHIHHDKPSRISWDLPFVHIVNTRFMQSQGHLVTLARARLELFQTFCLPTMVAQTSQNFLWIIKTDPNLNETIRDEMIDLLKPYPNYFLVGSENNYLIGHLKGAWRGGVEGRDILFHSKIYTGDAELLKRAYDVESDRVVLQTRLDADDGLNSNYLQFVQDTAVDWFIGHSSGGVGSGGDESWHTSNSPMKSGQNENALSESKSKPRWMYWCSRRVVEWFADPNVDIGEVQPIEHSELCVTPGITVGFNVGAKEDTVPNYQHDELYKAIKRDGGCGLERNMDCISLVDKLSFSAVRSRTPTSAGMMGITLEKNSPWIQIKDRLSPKLWAFLETGFDVTRENARRTNQFIQRNLREIAMDNLKGQCTLGHSCKLSSKEQLQRLTELAAGAGDTLEVKIEDAEHR